MTDAADEAAMRAARACMARVKSGLMPLGPEEYARWTDDLADLILTQTGLRECVEALEQADDDLHRATTDERKYESLFNRVTHIHARLRAALTLVRTGPEKEESRGHD